MAEENLVTKEVDESLRRLKSLCDDGIISQSDFEEKKNQLLRLSAQPAKREAPPPDTPPPAAGWSCVHVLNARGPNLSVAPSAGVCGGACPCPCSPCCCGGGWG